MFRFVAIGLFFFSLIASKPMGGSDKHAPWVSCFSESGHKWEGPKTIRTPNVISSDGTRKAYAQIEAIQSGPSMCENTVHLFVSTQDSAGFHEVFTQKPSPLGGTANSLGPNSWSPDGRWLLVEFGRWFYDSDAGGLGILLYDKREGQAVSPDLTRIVQTNRKQKCSIMIVKVVGFDTLSRVRLKLADNIEDGEDHPETHCFHGTEEWALNPANETMQLVSRRP